MGEYLTIYFGTSSAAPKAVEWDKAMVVGDGSPALAATKVYELSSSTWDTELGADGFTSSDRLYKSVAMFFGATPSPDRLFVYAHVSGTVQTYGDIPLVYVSGNTWETPIKPVAGFQDGIEKVKFWGCGEDIESSGVENFANGASGVAFYVDKGVDGKWTGLLGFNNGLSGTVGVVNPVTSDCKVTANFTAGTQSSLGTAIDEYGINMVALALDNSDAIKNFADNVFGSQLDDMMTIRNAIAGKNCIWFYCLPGNANPDDLITDTSNKWSELKSVLGARDQIAVIKAIPSVDDDMAVGYMAMTAISHPHKQMTFAEPHMGVQAQEPAINRGKWKDGQIGCIMKRTELSGNPFLVTYGFTFGSGDFSKIEGARCRIIISQSLINNLWGLLAKRETLMSYDGMQKIKAQIVATFNILQSQGIVDGLKSVKIPIEEDLANNTVAGQIARQQQTVPAVEIEYLWYTSVERIIITRAENVAT
jgi:hypothetical protein